MTLNLITDVAGIRVGHAADARIRSGVTVLLADEPLVAAAHVMGGAPGTRETDLLSPDHSVQTVDAIVLSGGSVFGLDAASGVTDALAAMGRGFPVGTARAPIVPGAILFDLLNGGDKDWGPVSPYRALGKAALEAAAESFALGSAGAGTGATTADLKGGLGSASERLPNGVTVGALVAVNAVGRATIGNAGHFRAAPFEKDGEFGGRGLPVPLPKDAAALVTKAGRPAENTTLAIVATDAALTKAEAKRLAVMAHDGFAHALWPAHTPMDGDIVFAVSTGRVPLPDPTIGLMWLGAAAASCTARAIARGVYEASSAPGDLLPSWRHIHGQASRATSAG